MPFDVVFLGIKYDCAILMRISEKWGGKIACSNHVEGHYLRWVEYPGNQSVSQ